MMELNREGGLVTRDTRKEAVSTSRHELVRSGHEPAALALRTEVERSRKNSERYLKGS